MTSSRRPFFAHSDELLFGSHLLAALDVGALDMHAKAYTSIACRVVELISMLRSSVVARLRDEGPRAIRPLAEKVLHLRGDPAWSGPESNTAGARRILSSLLGRLHVVRQG